MIISFNFPSRYPEQEQLQQIVQAYLQPVLDRQLGERHPVWSQRNKVYTLAGSMVQVYEQVRNCEGQQV